MSTSKEIFAEFKRQGFQIFNQPFELNIVGVRNPDMTPNSFNDRIYVIYKLPSGKWVSRDFAATTDPGTYWLNNPMQPQGTAILKTGQYLDAYKIAMHQSSYYALCQRLKKVTVIRDYDRNSVLDFNNGRQTSGFYGINIHRARKTGTTTVVNKYSAGCQVFANADDFAAFMALCERHRNHYGNKFTYTLIDLRSLSKKRTRNLGAGLLALGGTLGLGLWAHHYFSNSNVKQ